MLDATHFRCNTHTRKTLEIFLIDYSQFLAMQVRVLKKLGFQILRN